MDTKLIIYVLCVVISTYGISSLDLNRFFKQGKIIEARIFAIMLIFSMAELVSSFLIDFLDICKL